MKTEFIGKVKEDLENAFLLETVSQFYYRPIEVGLQEKNTELCVHFKMVYFRLALMRSQGLECIFVLASVKVDSVHVFQCNTHCTGTTGTCFICVLVIQIKQGDSDTADFSENWYKAVMTDLENFIGNKQVGLDEIFFEKIEHQLMVFSLHLFFSPLHGIYYLIF